MLWLTHLKIFVFNLLGNYAYIDEPIEAWIESSALPWKPTYEKVGFCLQFHYLLPEKAGLASLKVTLNYDNNQEVIWKVSGFHGSEWLLARISWSPSRSSKVILYFDGAKIDRKC